MFLQIVFLFVLLLLVLLNTPGLMRETINNYCIIWKIKQFIYIEIKPMKWTFVVFAKSPNIVFVYLNNQIDSCGESLQKAYVLHNGQKMSNLDKLTYECIPSLDVLHNLAANTSTPTRFHLRNLNDDPTVIDVINYIGKHGMLSQD
jgi:hypothetical protein